MISHLKKSIPTTMAEKRTILVTGCSDGSLGSALALALHHVGWRVFASARNLSKLTAAKDAGIECVQMDVGSDESISAAVEQVKQLTGGSLDGLVNNAGGGYMTPIIHVDIAKAHDLFELNVFSIIRVTQGFLPLLLKSDRGAIIANNTSGSGLLGVGTAFHGAYNASKAAAASITENLRIELVPFGIRVINLVTGAVKSTFHTNAIDCELPPDSIYNVAKDVVEQTMAGNMTGMKAADPNTWAKQVAADISQRNPPHAVYRGGMAGTARLGTLLPTGTLDGTMKKMAGVDVLERRIKEKGGLKKIREQ
ncbi:hypothetical protein B0J13DRAFT_566238 [Dactylonectria estremocensis]|uniref:Uncharacterized protein n=1 Tax=Dactylonectria estremocensis TaxID=1079267 RepID=A0A9P9DQK7_9HYPO|nr:hypothetical protein B0J13DRAFT_566238 [Dactylonectria estremocensis]